VTAVPSPSDRSQCGRRDVCDERTKPAGAIREIDVAVEALALDRMSGGLGDGRE
jgi:hypothetical protein